MGWFGFMPIVAGMLMILLRGPLSRLEFIWIFPDLGGSMPAEVIRPRVVIGLGLASMAWGAVILLQDALVLG